MGEGEARRVVGVSEKVFGVGREKRRLLQFYWVKPMNDAAEECFRRSSERTFISSDTLSNTIQRSKTLKGHYGGHIDQARVHSRKCGSQATPTGVADAGSILCVQKHNPLNKERNHNVERGCSYRALGLHLSIEDHQFHVTSGSRSVSFDIPGGCLVVSEWSGGDLEMVTGEAIFEPNEDAEPSYLIEFMCSPLSLNVEPVDPSEKKIISLMDQLLIILSLTLLHLFWTWISSVFAS
ncbi:hypothetical protein QJS10_CPA03g00965 [Acorus calamus]|uniref:Uncharacterized protein n=1 Tax=Acorus calamus TaxID=4465 RepID=A0AAV9F5U9_ACOCL|nr:hypothetical protein QJS10_CPA03g00965 [Acorus calamus]